VKLSFLSKINDEEWICASLKNGRTTAICSQRLRTDMELAVVEGGNAIRRARRE
jgi:hypothetical protein